MIDFCRRMFVSVLSLGMVLTLLPLTVTAYNYRIKNSSGERTLEQVYHLGQPGDNMNLRVRPGEEIRIPLTADMFQWDKNRTPLPMESLRIQELNNSLVRVSHVLTSEGRVLDYVQFDVDTFAGKPFLGPGNTKSTGKTAYISVMFTDRIVSTEDVDFTIDISVFINKRRDSVLNFSLSGTMLVDTLEVDSNETIVDIRDGTVVEAVEFAKNVKLDLGKGVTITRNLLPGAKYYAVCDVMSGTDTTIKDAYPNIYPSVQYMYKLTGYNVRGGTSKVTLDPHDNQDYFVYGEDLKYLGRTSDQLPYSDMYILSVEELPTLEIADEYLENPPTNEKVVEAVD